MTSDADAARMRCMQRRIEQLERVIVMARREFRKRGCDPVDARAWLFRVSIIEENYPAEQEVRSDE